MRNRWQDFDISTKGLTRITLLSVVLIVGTVALGIGAFILGVQNKGDIQVTNDVVKTVDSACARVANTDTPTKADVAECARIRRQADKDQPLADACISQKKVLKPKYYEIVTRCPRNLAAALAENEANGSSTEQEQPKPAEKVTERDGQIALPDGPADSPDPGPSDTPPDNPVPSKPDPPSSPTVPDPPAPSAPAPSSPTVSLPGVSVDIKPSGTCVNALGIPVSVGTC